METFTLELFYVYNSTGHEIFAAIEDGTLFDLTGADEITFYFKEDGVFSFLFHERGEIFGRFTKIDPYKNVMMDWNVIGFDKPDERDTKLELSIEQEEGNKSRLTVLNTEIKTEVSFEAKKTSWQEILENFEKELLKGKN